MIKISQSCLDCKYFKLHSSDTVGMYCDFNLPVFSLPHWVVVGQLNKFDNRKISQEQPYTDCNTWAPDPELKTIETSPK